MTLPQTTAEGTLSLSDENLARTIAGSARWQTLVEADNETEALANVWIDGMPLPTNDDDEVQEAYTAEQLDELRPFALIGPPPRAGYQFPRIATDTYDESGSHVILFEFPIDENDRNDDGEISRKFKNNLGVILGEMQALAYTPGYLAINRFQVDGPFRVNPEQVNELGDFIYALVTVFWGAQQ